MGNASSQVPDVTAVLRDGGAIRLRSIRPDDGPALVDFHARLSPESVHRRYFSAHPRLSPQEVRHLTNVDDVDRLAYVAEDQGRLVGVGRYERTTPTEAEVAFVVADDHQHRGIGSLLLDALCDAALARGITAFTADTLSGNSAMLDVFRHGGYPMESRYAGHRARPALHRAHIDLRRRSGCKAVGVLILGGPVSSPLHRVDGHPERPERIGAAMAGVADLRLGNDLSTVAGRPPTDEELERVHTRSYLEELAAYCALGGGDLDPDTYALPGSFEEARNAVGAGLATIDALEAAGEGVAFAVARPPGHHATATQAMGFCLLNSVAVSAASLAARGERVLIVDWDVHHGNGTQDIFWDDPSVLYVSLHQWPLFPGSGRPDEVGGARALGRTVNIPVPPGATGDVLRAGLELVALPTVEEFDPTWVLVSAGFDAHRSDPMAELALSSADFAALATLVRKMTPASGPLALFLEGGYDLGGIQRSVAATVGALLDVGTGTEDPTFGGPGIDTLARIAETRRRAIEHGLDRPDPEEEPR